MATPSAPPSSSGGVPGPSLSLKTPHPEQEDSETYRGATVIILAFALYLFALLGLCTNELHQDKEDSELSIIRDVFFGIGQVLFFAWCYAANLWVFETHPSLHYRHLLRSSSSPSSSSSSGSPSSSGSSPSPSSSTTPISSTAAAASSSSSSSSPPSSASSASSSSSLQTVSASSSASSLSSNHISSSSSLPTSNRPARCLLREFLQGISVISFMYALFCLQFSIGLFGGRQTATAHWLPIFFLIFSSLYLYLSSHKPSASNWTTRHHPHHAFARLLFEVVVAIVWPFYGFNFAHLLLSDLLTSACLCLFQLELLVCTLTTTFLPGSQFHRGTINSLIAKPLACFLPVWIRFVQCLYCFTRTDMQLSNWSALQHLLNAAKYLGSMLVIIVTVVINSGIYEDQSRHDRLVTWLLIIQAVKTVGSLLWDVCIDWDLGKSFGKSSGSLPLLRPRRLLRWTWFYYLALAVNLGLRLTWILFVCFELSSSWVYFTALLEIFRRAVWMVLRVESQAAKREDAVHAVRLKTFAKHTS